MHRLQILRRSMTQWRLFGIACIFVGGLLLKAGAPIAALVVGLAVAALANWVSRRRSGDPTIGQPRPQP